jgi:Flp pilus assembly pilin Flp
MLVTSLGVRDPRPPVHLRVLLDERVATTVEYLVLLAFIGLGVCFAVRELQAAVVSSTDLASDSVARLQPLEFESAVPVTFERMEPKAATGVAHEPSGESDNFLQTYRRAVMDSVDAELDILRLGNRTIDSGLRAGGKVLNRIVPIDSNRFRDAAHSWVMGSPSLHDD